MNDQGPDFWQSLIRGLAPEHPDDLPPWWLIPLLVDAKTGRTRMVQKYNNWN